MENSATFPDLAGKVAIVTGIGQIGTRERWGNGAATARLLCHNGVKVFGCDIDIDAAVYTKTRIEAEGGTVEITQADVTSSADVKRLVSECVAKFGRVDILVNNVGRSEPGGPAEIEENIWSVNKCDLLTLC
jgi:NAD(P)-dependent dehydrogenase (short-subunit alcohol dehydrogenase family)